MNTFIKRASSNMRSLAKQSSILMVAIATSAIAMASASTSALAQSQAGGKKSPAKADVTFALDYVPDGLHAPIYAAQNMGYIDKANLAIEPGGGSSLTIKLVSEGRAQVGIADAGSVSVAVAKGAKVKAIALLLKHTPAVTMVSENSSIKQISDLKGKSIGDFPEASTSVLLPALLRANGLSENDVKFVGMNFSARVPSLQAGRVDAIDGYVQEFVTLPNTFRRIIWAENNFNVYGPVLIVNNDFAQQHGDIVRSILQGFKKGLEVTAAQPRQVAEVLAKASRGDLDYFEKEIDVLHAFFADPASVNMTSEGWTAVQDVMMQFGGQAKKLPEAELFTNEFIEAQ
ncbi:hypothetical protein CSC67_02310 [Pusillimonas caeni]|uniref:ABC transporter substrate-binding protein n=1 Tax=Pusillimonas caeni TaxID=1348472 RepID=UPI000E599462|nr:ABC transporter substrate-binding protein [Pusillimonas caeni]TFL15581.1 hypothetical protein CSC67_02310 [Pusillimonas caeni]